MIKLRHRRKNLSAVLCFTLLILQGVTAHSQEYDKLIIHSGDSISRHYTWLFPSFENATVKFRDGRIFVYEMNFNTMLCDMQYIGRNGDTLAITNAELVDSIRFDSSSFIYDYKKGYFQIVAGSGAVSFAIYRRTSFEPVQAGGMGEARQSGGVEVIDAINTRQGMLPPVLNQDMYALKKTAYYLISKNGDFENAGKGAFLKIYHGDRKSFERYVRQNKIDFNDQADLEKLFHFCVQS